MRRAFGKIERWDYVSDGNDFPNGTAVAQYAYHQSGDGRAWVTLRIGAVKSQTRIVHEFTGAGSELPQSLFPPAFRAMERASVVLWSSCRIDLSASRWKAVGQDVQILN